MGSLLEDSKVDTHGSVDILKMGTFSLGLCLLLLTLSINGLWSMRQKKTSSQFRQKKGEFYIQKYVDEKRDPFGEFDKKNPTDNALHGINNSEEETRVKKGIFGLWQKFLAYKRGRTSSGFVGMRG